MRKFLINIFLIIIPFLANSQDVQFVASAHSKVNVGKAFYITYTLQAAKEGSNFQRPKLDGFELLNVNTSRSSNTSVTIVNGKMKQNSFITLTWYLTVKAKKEGTFKIPTASVKVDGKTYKSNSLVIKVVKGETAYDNNSKSKRNNYSNIQQTSKKLFLNLTTDKVTAYVGEAIYTYCRMFSRYDGINIQEFNASTFDDFWIKNIKMPNSVKGEQVELNNTNYLAATLDKKVIFPQRSGTITIKPYNAVFQLYDGWGFPAGTKKVVSNKKIITIKPLPANKPASFSGAVGQYSISLTSKNYEIKVDEALVINVNIQGKGNFGLFDLPKVNLPNSFESLNAETKDNFNITSEGVSGSTIVKYSFIARVPGKYKIPQLVFSYFDPKKEKYITLKTDTLSITVIGDARDSILSNNNVVKNEITELGSDIRYLKTGMPNLKKQNNFIFATKEFFLVYVALFLLFILLVLFLRKKKKENAEIELLRFKRADKISKKRMRKAAKCIKNKNSESFYEETSKALWGYFSDKLSISLAELTRDSVKDTLLAHKVDTDLIDELLKVIDICEISRFAPSNSNNQIEQVYRQASEVISTFEKNLLKKNKKL